MNKLTLSRGWSTAFGILFVTLGILALSAQAYTTYLSMIFFAWVLIIGGSIGLYQSFFSGEFGRGMLFFLGGILGLIIGGVVAVFPTVSATALTLFIGISTLVVGAITTCSSLFDRQSGWGGTFFSGIFMTLFGTLIIALWPGSGLWLLGLFLGVFLFVSGSFLVLKAFSHVGYENAGLSGMKGGMSKKRI